MNADEVSNEFDREIVVASRLAREAGDVILQIYHTDFVVQFKDKEGPVTEADRRASELIVAQLRREFPNDLVVSEEEPMDPNVVIPRRVWYVDPLDGTHEFIAKNGEFAVMIGLAIDGRACAGVVYQPTTKQLWAGIAGQQAWLEENRERMAIRVSDETDSARLRLVVSRSHRHPLLDEMRACLGIMRELRMGSVGLKVGVLAIRQADVYIDPSSVTHAWDSCAPEAILHGAGGRLTDVTGASLRYSPRELRNKRGLVATNGLCHEFVITGIAPIVARAGFLKRKTHAGNR
jgi:3'(2'), 5'-bisphosphate nucleotidase